MDFCAQLITALDKPMHNILLPLDETINDYVNIAGPFVFNIDP